MIAAGYVYNDEASQRALALDLAGERRNDRDTVDDKRKQVRRWLSGEQKTVQRRTAERLAEVLGTPVDYWPTSRVRDRPISEAIDQAERMVRRLEEGERFPRQDLLRAADAVDRATVACAQLAENLRVAARGGRLAR